MLKDLRKYENLGGPKYFFELLNSIGVNNEIFWTKKDIEQLFYNRNINGRFVFDGCLEFAKKISIIAFDDYENAFISDCIKNYLNSEKQMCDKIIECLFLTLNFDDDFYSIFSPVNLSYDIVYKSVQINNSAFGFKFSNFKQLLIDFDVIQIHPNPEINKFILNLRYKKLFEKIILPEIKKRKIGLEQLRISLEKQKINGEEAEEFVYKFEMERLSGKEGIDWVAQYSVAEGYDIASFRNNDSLTNDYFIEVKSYIDTPYFYWTRNEIDVSRLKGDNYYLYLVDRSQMNNPNYKPLIIQNPFINVLSKDKWIKQVEKYRITMD